VSTRTNSPPLSLYSKYRSATPSVSKSSQKIQPEGMARPQPLEPAPAPLEPAPAPLEPAPAPLEPAPAPLEDEEDPPVAPLDTCDPPPVDDVVEPFESEPPLPLLGVPEVDEPAEPAV